MNTPTSQTKIKLTKKTKIIIGIVIAILIPCFLVLLFIYGYRACFPENERLVVSEIRLTGKSRFWNPSDPNENYKRRTAITETLALTLGKTKIFELKPAECSAKLLEAFPSLKSAKVYRELPDRLIFELQERIPIANMVGSDSYLDEDGRIVSKAEYNTLDGTLPDVLIMTGGGRTLRYMSGDNLSNDASLLMVRDLIKITSIEIPDIRIKQIVIFRNNSSMDCTFLFQNDPTPFTATFPDKQNTDAVRNDLIPRLLAVLRDPKLLQNPKRKFIFRWKDSVVIPE